MIEGPGMKEGKRGTAKDENINGNRTRKNQAAEYSKA